MSQIQMRPHKSKVEMDLGNNLVWHFPLEKNQENVPKPVNPEARKAEAEGSRVQGQPQ